MVILACIGLFFIVLSGIINAIELKKFFKALQILNSHTRTIGDKFMFIPRFVCLIPKLAPIIPDLLFMVFGGFFGLGGGVLGFIIGIGGSCMCALIIKIALRAAKPSSDTNNISYAQAIAQIN